MLAAGQFAGQRSCYSRRVRIGGHRPWAFEGGTVAWPVGPAQSRRVAEGPFDRVRLSLVRHRLAKHARAATEAVRCGQSARARGDDNPPSSRACSRRRCQSGIGRKSGTHVPRMASTGVPHRRRWHHRRVFRLPRHRSHSADERRRHQSEPTRGKSGANANGAPEGGITRRVEPHSLVQCLENSPPGMASHAVSRVNKLSNGHGTSPSTERKALGPTRRWVAVIG